MIVAVQEGKKAGELKERIWRLENGARVINAASWLQKQNVIAVGNWKFRK